MIIDVDSHWETTGFAPGSTRLRHGSTGSPATAWRSSRTASPVTCCDALPGRAAAGRAHAAAGLVRAAEERGGPSSCTRSTTRPPAERVAWMDRVGIDHCLVNPGGYWQLLEFLGPDGLRPLTRCNDYLAEQLADRSDRLHGVAVVDFSDLERAAGALERARARGHRAFFLYTVNGRPPRAVPPGHPAWDPVWTAATRLGMLAVIHVGNTAADFGGWADIGWDLPGGGGVSALTRLANTQRIHVAQNLLVSMLYGGVFERHPDLTVVLEEMKVGWVPSFVDACTRQSLPSMGLGDWPYAMSGGDMLRRNVKFTPLPGFGDVEALDVVARLPQMCLFSSDYPHRRATPIRSTSTARAGELDDELRERFLGGNAADAFSRTGDPL